MNLSGIQKQRVETWIVKYLSDIGDNPVEQLHPFQQNAPRIPKSLNLRNDVCNSIYRRTSGVDNPRGGAEGTDPLSRISDGIGDLKLGCVDSLA